MVQMGFCDLSHTYHKQVTNVYLACFCHPTVGNFDVSPYYMVKSHMTVGKMSGTGGLVIYFIIHLDSNVHTFSIVLPCGERVNKRLCY